MSDNLQLHFLGAGNTVAVLCLRGDLTAQVDVCFVLDAFTARAA